MLPGISIFPTFLRIFHLFPSCGKFLIFSHTNARDLPYQFARNLCGSWSACCSMRKKMLVRWGCFSRPESGKSWENPSKFAPQSRTIWTISPYSGGIFSIFHTLMLEIYTTNPPEICVGVAPHASVSAKQILGHWGCFPRHLSAFIWKNL